MPASTTDKFSKTFNSVNPNVARVNASRSAGVTTLACDNLAGWPTDTVVHFSTYRVGTDGSVTAGTQIDWKGIVSGNNIGSLTRLAGATDAGNSINDVVEMNPTASWANDFASGILVQHKQDGSHGAVTADSLTTTGNVTIGGTLTIGGSGSGGWDAASGTVSAVTANGNRSYDLTISNDNTALISPGMRLRTTRTVAAPTQCATFDGVNDYFSKSSPAGMTFTDDFVVGAWVKLSSYAQGGIVSRFNGTNGWDFRVDSSGRIMLSGFNAASGNYSYVLSYQSIPLNKWVHVSAQLDMSAFTATTTTSYVMIDGVDVPCAVTRSGTNPTALVQAGDLQVGAKGGVDFFPGKIAQAFVSSAKITQANVKTLYSQGLTSALITANNIISAYSLSNSLTDLNTTNANNLTANGGVLATTADSPFGGQAGGTISSTLDYGIVAKVTASTITVNVAEGCTIPTSGGVSAVSYSGVKSPYGFPGQDDKWNVSLSLIARIASSAGIATGTVVNPGGLYINIPTGEWNLNQQMAGLVVSSVGVNYLSYVGGLSTSSSSISDYRLTDNSPVLSATAVQVNATLNILAPISVSTMTPYYYVEKSTVAGATFTFFTGADTLLTTKVSTLTAENAYL